MVLRNHAALPLVQVVMHSKPKVVVAHFKLLRIYRSCPSTTVYDQKFDHRSDQKGLFKQRATTD